VGSWECVVEENPVSFPNALMEKEEEASGLATLDVTI